MIVILHDSLGTIFDVVSDAEFDGTTVLQCGRAYCRPRCLVTMVPEQDTSRLRDGEGNWRGTLDDLIPYTVEEQAALVDRDTDRAIEQAVHSFAPVGEQIGILRDQLVQLLNALGIEATPDFARLNMVAVEAIEAARAKKEALNA